MASGSPTSLTSATRVRPCGEHHQLARLADQGDDRRAGHRPDGVRLTVRPAPIAGVRAPRRPGRAGTRREPAASAAATSTPRRSAPRSRAVLRRIAGPADVLVVDEELGGVGALVDAGDREDREPGRPVPQPVDQLGERPALLGLGHPPLDADRPTASPPGRLTPIGSVSRIHRWAARSWAFQPSQSVGASGPTWSNRSHSSARSVLAKVLRELAAVTTDADDLVATSSSIIRTSRRERRETMGRVTGAPRQPPAQPGRAPAPSTPRSPPCSSATPPVWSPPWSSSTTRGEVLMVGWMDDEALHRTLTTGRATFWSRSRREYWVKGETSGHRQWVREVAAGLRRRHPAGQGRPGGRGLPHRRPHLLRRPAAARSHPRPGRPHDGRYRRPTWRSSATLARTAG